MKRFRRVKRFENDETINLPKRQTHKAVAYDFEAAEDITIPSLFMQVWDNISRLQPPAIKPYLIKTGVKATFPESVGLFIANRSGGPKRGLVLANSIGVIDSDYDSNPDNDGEIMFAFYNFSLQTIVIKKGERIGQGWLSQVFFMDDDEPVDRKRESGHGHTGA